MQCKVLIVDGLGKKGIEKLKIQDNVDLLDKTGIDRNELFNVISDIEILIVRSRTKVDRELINCASKLKLICRAGIGVDNVDVEAATSRGIIVMNAPQGNIVTTAEHTIALLMALTRNIVQADASIRQLRWEKKNFEGHELRGKIIGIIGLGNIGRVVAELANGLKMSVIGYDPFITDEVAKKYNVKLVEWETLLKSSDYITIHVPQNESTLKLINATTFKLMKRGLYLVNSSRGGIVDEKAVIEALETGIIKGYAADVFEKEPISHDHPFLKHPRVIMTPHLGASTFEAQEQVGIECADAIIEFVTTGVLKNTINVPALSSIEMEVLTPYINLCERIGIFASELNKQKEIRKVVIRYDGAFPVDKFELPTSSLIKGILTKASSDPPNIVNATSILKKKGISLEIVRQSDSSDFIGRVSVSILGEREELYVSGTLFGKDNYRLLKVNKFDFDTYLGGNLLVIENIDQPGVIGALGKFLADRNINIANMQLSRDSSIRHAMGVITIDTTLAKEDVKEILNIKGINFVKGIVL